MRAAVLRHGEMVVRDDVPEPEPTLGQVLVQVKACGICGSDLHFAKHGGRMLELGAQMRGMPSMGNGDGLGIDLGRDVFMGHEFSGEILEVGPDTQTLAPGTTVTSLPILLSMTGIEPIVYSNSTLGGYAERMLLSAPLLIEVPNGLDPAHAALTEPMAVGLHGVNKSRIKPGDGALVLGCGPVGIAVVAALKLKGIETIVAADFSPARRALATTMGATTVADPAAEPSFDAWARVGQGTPVIFECIGVPGIIDGALRDAPPGSQLVVVGVCMEPDSITPFWGISKELNIQFALGYDPNEFAQSLRSMAEGDIDVAPVITGEVGLDGVAGAFADLGDPERHCKILVRP
jgi:threonine dehydrogenase-like Zn-dependent dehydrogenase